MVCESHTTSKINDYEDLRKVETFGFRGEALSSISHVAHVKIISFPLHQKTAFSMQYIDGKPKVDKPGEKQVKSKTCAGIKGTIVIVEDLFYNVPTRRKAIKNTNEEYNRVIDVVKLYSINNFHVRFTCRKHDEGLADLHYYTFYLSFGNDSLSLWGIDCLQVESSTCLRL